MKALAQFSIPRHLTRLIRQKLWILPWLIMGFCSSWCLAQTSSVTITINSPAHGSTFANAAQVLTGTVSPVDAQMQIDGQTVTVQADGSWSSPINLHDGLNTYTLKGTKADYTSAVRTIDLYWDQTPPTIRILSPTDNAYLNQASFQVTGTVEDIYDRHITLTRDGQSIAVSGGRFLDVLDGLANGTTTVTYEAEDSAGNTASQQVTFHINNQPPNLQLTAPQQVQIGDSFQVNLEATPAEDIESVEVWIGSELVYSGDVGGEHLIDYSFPSGISSLALIAQARDRYGNSQQAQTVIKPAKPTVVFGQVLADDTGYPLAGVTVQITTPLNDHELTTDTEGRYQATVHGLPVSLRIQEETYLPMARQLMRETESWRVLDLRLTPRDQPLPEGMIASASGFSAAPSFASFSDQALPALLPLGWSPIAGLSVEQGAGSGQIDWQAPEIHLPSNATLVLLRREEHGWQVVSKRASDAFSFQFPTEGSGHYLAALSDDETMATSLTEGTPLVRDQFRWIPPNTALRAETNPEMVSILNDPTTVLSYTVQDGAGLPSGSQTRIAVQEQHHFFHLPDRLDRYGFDLLVYRYGFAVQEAADRLGGSLTVRARGTIDPVQTERAQLLFRADSTRDQPVDMPDDRIFRLPSVSLNFSDPVFDQAIMDVFALPVNDLPLPAGTQLLQGFQMTLTTPLPQAPLVNANSASTNTVALLLLQQQDFGWSYAGQLLKDGELWSADPAELNLREAGTYALVSSSFPITEVAGSVTGSGAPLAIVSGEHLPWFGDRPSDDSYRLVVSQSSIDQIVWAVSNDRRFQGERTLPQTTATNRLTAQDLDLQPVNFSILEHEPAHAARHVPLLPKISLHFNQPVSEDANQLVQAIQLTDDQGQQIPIQILPEPGRQWLYISPKQALAKNTLYQLSVANSLQSQAGDPYNGLNSFNFTTRTTALERNLDLLRFHLSWNQSTSTMTLIGPPDAYPAGTRLEVLVRATGFSLTTTLTNGEFQRIITALPGDVVTLTAETPDGQIHTYHLSRIVREDGAVIVGSQPTVLALDSETFIETTAAPTDSLTPFTINDLSTAALGDFLSNSSNLVDGPLPTPIKGFTLHALGGESLPRLTGQVMVNLDATSLPNGFLHWVAIVPDVVAPANPTEPDQLQAHDFLYLMDVHAVLDGAVLGEGVTVEAGITSVSMRLDLNDRRIPLGSDLVLALVHTNSVTAKGSAYDANPANDLAARVSGGIPQHYTIRALRKNTDIIEPPRVEPAPWHANFPDYHPVPGAYIYRVLIIGGSPDIRLVGICGPDGEASVYSFAPMGKMRGLDPVTGELAYVGLGNPHFIEDSFGQSLVITSSNKVTFDPIQHLIQTGQSPPPSLNVKWSVGQQTDAGFVEDSRQTATLNRVNKIEISPTARLRVVVESDQPIASSPAPSLTTTDGLNLEPNDLQSQRAVFEMTPGSLSSERLLSLELKIANEGGQISTVRRHILVIGQGTPPSRPGAPVLVKYLPADGDAVPINEIPYLAFSEPVVGIGPQSVQLLRDSEALSLNFLDQNGFEVGPNDPVTELYIVPRQSLRFSSLFTLQVNNLRDLDGNLLENHVSEFSTPPVEVESVQNNQDVQAMAGYRNLVLTLVHDWAARDLQFKLHDIRSGTGRMQTIWQQDLRLPPAIRYHLALFTPDQLAEDGDANDATTLRRDLRDGRALDHLPVGTIAAVAYLRYGGNRSELRLFQFNGSSFEHLNRYPLLGNGWPEAVAAMGKHLFIGYLQLTDVGPTPVRGETVVYDLPALIRDFAALQARFEARELTPFEYEKRLFSTGIVAKYPVPGDVRHISTFFRKAEDHFQSAFLVSGSTRPAIYPFDLSRQPVALGIPVEAPGAPGGNFEADGITAKYDGRMLAYTDYPSGYGLSKKGNGAVEQFTYQDPRTNQLRQSDFAIFSNNEQNVGTILVYEIPSSLIPTQSALDPLMQITIPQGVASLSVDPRLGFIAFSTRDSQLATFDLRVLLEGLPSNLSGTHLIPNGLENDAVMFNQKNVDVAWLRFHEGNLFGGDNLGRFHRMALAPKDFREIGWAVYDLASWLKPDTQGTQETLAPKLVDSVVLYANDLTLTNGGQSELEFVMELGTFNIEIRDSSNIEVQIHRLENGQAQGEPIAVMERNNLSGRRLEPFSTHALAAYYANPLEQAALREKLYQGFRLTYRVIENQVLVASDQCDFAVAYLGPFTGDLDANRSLDGLDGLRMTPDFGAVDFPISSSDPRLSLAPSRVYRGGRAFQRGAFGVGMQSGQLLHMALPAWWRPGQIGGDRPASTAAVQRFMVEQPGHFHRQFLLQENEKPAAIDDLISTLDKVHGTWRLTLDDQVNYVFASGRSIPRFYDQFIKKNPAIDAEPERFHFPLFRLQDGPEAPGQLYAEVPLRTQEEIVWQNKLIPTANSQPATRPTKLLERVNDAAKGHRQLDWDYHGRTVGQVISTIEERPRGTHLTYQHDLDGYLTEVKLYGERPIRYTWQDIGLTIGRLPIKRLKRIEQGDWFREYRYANPSDLTVQSMISPFGTQTLTVIRDVTGLPATVTVGGTADVPDYQLTFGDAGGQILVHGVAWANTSFNQSWQRITREGRAEWRLATHSNRGQIFTYDDRGRLTHHEQGGGHQSWTYDPDNPFGFWQIPITFTDANGQIFETKVDAGSITVSAEGSLAKRHTLLSGSGVPFHQTELDGSQSGADDTAYYLPQGNGYVQALGWPVTQPLPNLPELLALVTEFNKFGDLTLAKELGQWTHFSNFDDLGRPEITELPSGIPIYHSYSYEDGLRVTTVSEPVSGMTSTTKSNALGWTVDSIETLEGQTQQHLHVDYDALGRITHITDLLENQVVYHAQYNGQSPIPTFEESQGSRVTYTTSDGYVPTLTSVTEKVDELIRTQTFVSDSLGQITQFEVPVHGLVTRTYDPWGRPVSDTPNSGSQAITYEYTSDRTVIANDPFRNLRTTITTTADGLETTTTFEDTSSTSTQKPIKETRRIDIDQSPSGPGKAAVSLGFHITETVTTNAQNQIPVFQTVDASGQWLAGGYGRYQSQADLSQLDRWGQVLHTTGSIQSTITTDDAGRTTSLTDGNGRQVRNMMYDARGRLQNLIGPRDKVWTLDHFAGTGILKNLQVGESAESPTTRTLLDRPNWKDTTLQSWLGDSRKIEPQELGGNVSISRPLPRQLGDSVEALSSGEISRTVHVDPERNLPNQQSTFTGDSTQLTWSAGGTHLMATHPDSTNSEIQLDFFGNLSSIVKDGEPLIEASYDENNFLTGIDLQNGARSIQFHYDGARISRIDGGDHPIHLTYAENDPIGVPTKIDFGDIGALTVLENHPSGTPKLMSFSPAGGLPITLGTNEHGDLNYLKDGINPAINYVANAWGPPASMQIAGGPVYKLFSGDNPRVLELPGGTTATVDTAGRLATLQLAGLALVDFQRDADNRVTHIAMDGQITEQRVYIDGHLSAVIQGPDQNPSDPFYDQISYGHDAFGRVNQATSSLDGTESYTYNRRTGTPEGVDHPNRLASYTDPNGVVYQYQYDRQGRITVIDLVDGPSFHYQYDAAGFLTHVQVGNMATRFEDYRLGRPSALTWQSNGLDLDRFTVTLHDDGRLASMVGPNHALELTWSAAPEGELPAITEVVRHGPGFYELWEPIYATDHTLTAITITRTTGSTPSDAGCSDCLTETIEEDYGLATHQLFTALHRKLDGVTILDQSHNLDAGADQRRLGAMTVDGQAVSLSYDNLGSLLALNGLADMDTAFAVDHNRRLRTITMSNAMGNTNESYFYDRRKRRVTTTTANTTRVYAWSGSQVLAIGEKDDDGLITWSHAFGHGPMGPAFMKDLTGAGYDAFIVPDHLGTPFAWVEPNTGTTRYTPYNPLGELLATHPDRAPPFGGSGLITANGFQVADDAVFPIPPLGLAGHLIDHTTGLVYMHNRYYHPRLNHFITPDYRAPDIYDPTTLTEPYAYAAGNPILFWDPDGLSHFPADVIKNILEEGKDLKGHDFLDFAFSVLKAANRDPDAGGFSTYDTYGVSFLKFVPILHFVENKYETELNQRLMQEGLFALENAIEMGGPTVATKSDVVKLKYIAATFEKALSRTYTPRGVYYFGAAKHRAIRFEGWGYQTYHYFENQAQKAGERLLLEAAPGGIFRAARQVRNLRIRLPKIQTIEFDTSIAMSGGPGKIKIRKLTFTDEQISTNPGVSLEYHGTSKLETLISASKPSTRQVHNYVNPGHHVPGYKAGGVSYNFSKSVLPENHIQLFKDSIPHNLNGKISRYAIDEHGEIHRFQTDGNGNDFHWNGQTNGRTLKGKLRTIKVPKEIRELLTRGKNRE